jgi:hypothetical protein
MKDWSKRLEQIEEWRKSPPAIDLSFRGSPFAGSSKNLKRLHVTMKPLWDDMLIFEVSEIQALADPLLTESQKKYLRSFNTER